jgi:transposase
MGQRRNFSKEFKLEAVNLVVLRGVSVAQACRDLDISENVMRRWIREFKSTEGQAFPGHGVQRPNDVELTRLRREVAKLKMERDILKKAAAFFAKEST